ncbi:MAG: hypothetical protein DRP87_18345 [Spirochaetes bacterium]|nr:MAG: hypothetical protein DRP87_18345 [Spirochaetota bacterium]
MCYKLIQRRIMRKSITISIPEELEKEIDTATKEEGYTRSDLIRESLKDYLYFRKLNKLRDVMRLKARNQGIVTDQDVFEKLL